MIIENRNPNAFFTGLVAMHTYRDYLMEAVVTAELPRPTLWHVPGGANPRLRATFTNDDDVYRLRFQRAEAPDADDDDWTDVGTAEKPATIVNHFLEKADLNTDVTDTYYYRARQESAFSAYSSHWSNVARCDIPTFFFVIRGPQEHIRGVQLYADTAAALDRGVTWFEAMAQLEHCHRKVMEKLGMKFKAADLEEILEYPPADVVEIAKLATYLEILSRAHMNSEERMERIELVQQAHSRAVSEFYREGRVVLANGVTKTFVRGRIRPC